MHSMILTIGLSLKSSIATDISRWCCSVPATANRKRQPNYAPGLHSLLTNNMRSILRSHPSPELHDNIERTPDVTDDIRP